VEETPTVKEIMLRKEKKKKKKKALISKLRASKKF